MQQRIQRFDRILKLREDDRRSEQITLAAERREEMDVLDRLSTLEREKTAAIQDFSTAGENGMSATELWTQRQFIGAIDTDIVKGKSWLTDVRQRIAGTEARLVERHKDVRIMETYIGRLKEIDFKERLGVEQMELDDLATTQFARVQSGGVRHP